MGQTDLRELSAPTKKPWYLLCGESGVGKNGGTCVERICRRCWILRGCRSPIPAREINGTFHVRLVVFSATPSFSTRPGEPDRKSGSALDFIPGGGCANARPMQPINGMLLAVFRDGSAFLIPRRCAARHDCWHGRWM